MRKLKKVDATAVTADCGKKQDGAVMKMDRDTVRKFLGVEDSGIFQTMRGQEDPEILVDYVYGLQAGRLWMDFICCFPYRTRFLVFLYIKDSLKDKTYYELLGQVLGTVYTWDYSRELLYLIYNRSRRYMKYMMDPDERNALAALNASVIYRGCSSSNSNGHSWTLDLEQAKFFARRHAGKAIVLKGEFDKSDVMAYFERDNEIFIDPKKVRNITVVEERENWHRERWDVHGRIYAMTAEDPVYQEFRKLEVDFGFWFINYRNNSNLEALGPDFKREVIASMARRRKGVRHAA